MGLFDAVKDAFASDEQKLADRQAELAALQSRLATATGADADKLRKEIDDVATEVGHLKGKLGVSDMNANADHVTVAEAVETAAPEPVVAAAAPVAEAVVTAAVTPEHRTYTVKKGDTLSKIGHQYGVPYMAIAKLNNIKNPDLIYPGQVFKIPN